MVDSRSATLAAFEAFSSRQRAMYAGGDVDAVRAALAEDVVWHVPGHSAIAGDHRGRDAVLAYFLRRRALAGGAMVIVHRAQMTYADVVMQLADGEAQLDGERLTWRTAGVYRIADGVIAEAWLVPLEPARFEEVWLRLSREAGLDGPS
jgi:ketosteroid isomerase-like protein